MTNQPRQNSPTKRKAKPTGKKTGGRPTQKLQTTRGLSLRTDETIEKLPNNNTREKPASSTSKDNQSTTSSVDVAPSPKRQTQKRLLPTIIAPQRELTRNCQSTVFGNPVPINAVSEKNKNYFRSK